ncbi:MAG: SigB/SigF/SigG family RNA polymerase sigma factor [Abditibacteriaceae bacterium]
MTFSTPKLPTSGDSSDSAAQQEFDLLFAKWHETGDPALREKLIFMHVNLVRFLARRFAERGESQDDLQQQGMIGLIRALDNYDPSREVRFVTFATPTIIGEIRHYFRDKTHSVRVPRQVQEVGHSVAMKIETLSHELGRSPSYREIAASLGMSVENVIQCVEAVRLLDTVSLDESRSEEDFSGSLVDQMPEETSFLHLDDLAALQMAMDKLPDRERRALGYTYFEGYSQAEVARAMNVSQMHISRLLRKGLNLLRKNMEEKPRVDDSQD